MFPAGVIAHNSGVIASNSAVVESGYSLCILLLQHTSVDPSFFEFSGVFAELRRFYKESVASGNFVCQKSFYIYIHIHIHIKSC
jgi:hypothetical protein